MPRTTFNLVIPTTEVNHNPLKMEKIQKPVNLLTVVIISGDSYIRIDEDQ